MDSKPFSQACENNKAPILDVLERAFSRVSSVLEIGSGTGQHAIHFAQALPHLSWQPSDRAENLPGIRLWLAEFGQKNILPPIPFDLTIDAWPSGFNAVFSANTAHIMSWDIAQQMISGVGQHLPAKGIFALYGPFNYQGNFTSESNRRFDGWLKAIDPQQGIRDFESVTKIAEAAGLKLLGDHAMPANNRLLIWQKQ